MAKLRDVIGPILGRLREACDARNAVRICEETRLLLTALILRVRRHLEEWTSDLAPSVESHFLTAVEKCPPPYDQNVRDRCVDFLVVRYVTPLWERNVRPGREFYRWLHVAVRNLWREYIREQDDETMGRLELGEITAWTLQLVQEIEPETVQADRQASEFFGEAKRTLETLCRFVGIPSQSKREIRLTGCRSCSQVVRRLSAIPSCTEHAHPPCPWTVNEWSLVLWDAWEGIGHFPMPLRSSSAGADPRVPTIIANGRLDRAHILRILQTPPSRMSGSMDPLTDDRIASAVTETHIERQLQLLRPASCVERERFREEIRLSLLHRDEYVAYFDCWSGKGDSLRLCRCVIAHSQQFGPVCRAVEQWRAQNPELQKELVRVEYLEDSPEVGAPMLD